MSRYAPTRGGRSRSGYISACIDVGHVARFACSLGPRPPNRNAPDPPRTWVDRRFLAPPRCPGSPKSPPTPKSLAESLFSSRLTLSFLDAIHVTGVITHALLSLSENCNYVYASHNLTQTGIAMKSATAPAKKPTVRIAVVESDPLRFVGFRALFDNE